jgi:hypothetical protein
VARAARRAAGEPRAAAGRGEAPGARLAARGPVAVREAPAVRLARAARLAEAQPRQAPPVEVAAFPPEPVATRARRATREGFPGALREERRLSRAAPAVQAAAAPVDRRSRRMPRPPAVRARPAGTKSPGSGPRPGPCYYSALSCSGRAGAMPVTQGRLTGRNRGTGAGRARGRGHRPRDQGPRRQVPNKRRTVSRTLP